MSVPLPPAGLSARLSEARQDAQHFDSSGDLVLDAADAYVDLYGFSARARALFADDPEVSAAAQAVVDAATAYVLIERHGTGTAQWKTLQLDGSHGVAIFYPPSASSFYTASNYAFAAGATWNPQAAARGAADAAGGWGPLLVTYFRTTQPNGPDNPTPPRPLAPLAEAFRTFLPSAPRAARP
jgi:hypothetical protein